MESKIDWSKAPEGATHANGAGVFLRENKSGSVSNFDNGKWIMTSSTIADFNHGYIFERPTTPSWSGDGLPPVGVSCEVNDTRSDRWQPVDEVIAHASLSSGAVAVFRIGDYIAYSPPDRFRPIRTPEQIAADEREAAVDEMHKLYMEGAKHSGGLYALYDAGFRKP